MGKAKQYELLPKSRDPSYRRMEGNYAAKKYKKGTPAQIRLSFEMPDNRATQFIDIAKALSAINRRAVKQGHYFYVQSVELYDDADSTVNILTIPDTWTTRSAYRRAKGLYDEMTDKAIQTIGSGLPGKYHDFRVYMSDLHRTTGSINASLHGVNDVGQVILTDDWDYSQFVTTDPSGGAPADEFFAHMIGGEVTSAGQVDSVGLIESYSRTRATVQSDNPNMVNLDLTDHLLNMFDSYEESQNDIINNLNAANDEPPYNVDLYVGENANHMQHVSRLVTSTQFGRVAYGAGFCAPLGLICVDPLPLGGGQSPTPYRIVLNLAPGTYHGVYAERMA